MADRGNVLVTGAGGFVGCHLVSHLKRQGYWVRGVDLKYPDFCSHAADEFLLLDLRRQEDCLEATRDIDDVYALAADTGGSGFLLSRKVSATYNNLFIHLHTLESARIRRVKRYLLTSSTMAVAYSWPTFAAGTLPNPDEDVLLRQQTAALEQQLVEHLCLQSRVDYGLKIAVLRLPNVFGPFSPWEGGRERAPAALCRKIALAKLTQTPEVEIWGDGEQTRTFCYIEDCVSALYQAMLASHPISVIRSASPPLTISRLTDIIADIAGIQIFKRYIPVPENPRQNTADNTSVPQVAGMEPPTPIEQGLVNTYTWVEERVRTQRLALQST